jgi:hypothetical protein
MKNHPDVESRRRLFTYEKARMSALLQAKKPAWQRYQPFSALPNRHHAYRLRKTITKHAGCIGRSGIEVSEWRLDSSLHHCDAGFFAYLRDLFDLVPVRALDLDQYVFVFDLH